jgi:hypothetical protein
MENSSEQYRQINTVIELLKDARPLCQGAATAGLVESALSGAVELRLMMGEANWPPKLENQRSVAPELAALTDESAPAVDPAELCFPV